MSAHVLVGLELEEVLSVCVVWVWSKQLSVLSPAFGEKRRHRGVVDVSGKGWVGL